jgi:hypothetical protein
MWSDMVKTLTKRAKSAVQSATKSGDAANTIPVRLAGSIAFSGLSAGRPIAELTHQDIRKLLEQCEMRESHNAHICKRLQERGGACGIGTMNDFANAINNGSAVWSAEKSQLHIKLGGRGTLCVGEDAGLITLM